MLIPFYSNNAAHHGLQFFIGLAAGIGHIEIGVNEDSSVRIQRLQIHITTAAAPLVEIRPFGRIVHKSASVTSFQK